MNKLTRFVFKLFRVPPIKLNEVFTPTVAADLNYVARPQIRLIVVIRDVYSW